MKLLTAAVAFTAAWGFWFNDYPGLALLCFLVSLWPFLDLLAECLEPPRRRGKQKVEVEPYMNCHDPAEAKLKRPRRKSKH